MAKPRTGWAAGFAINRQRLGLELTRRVSRRDWRGSEAGVTVLVLKRRRFGLVVVGICILSKELGRKHRVLDLLTYTAFCRPRHGNR